MTFRRSRSHPRHVTSCHERVRKVRCGRVSSIDRYKFEMRQIHCHRMNQPRNASNAPPHVRITPSSRISCRVTFVRRRGGVSDVRCCACLALLTFGQRARQPGHCQASVLAPLCTIPTASSSPLLVTQSMLRRPSCHTSQRCRTRPCPRPPPTQRRKMTLELHSEFRSRIDESAISIFTLSTSQNRILSLQVGEDKSLLKVSFSYIHFSYSLTQKHLPTLPSPPRSPPLRPASPPVSDSC